MQEKLVSFSREDFAEDTWEILCDEFECSYETDTIMRLVLFDEDDDALGLYNDNDDEENEYDEPDDYDFKRCMR
jgi:hypothetical protein